MGEEGREWRRTNYHPRGLCSQDIQESLHVFRAWGGGALRIIWWRQKTPIILETYTCAGVESLLPVLHFGRCCSSYLLVVAQLVVQDDTIGLFRLRPRQGEAVHGGADLVHDGNNGGSCRVGEKGQTNGATVLAVNDEKRLVIKMSSSAKHVSHHSITGKKKKQAAQFLSSLTKDWFKLQHRPGNQVT